MVELDILPSAHQRHVTGTHNRLAQVIHAVQRVPRERVVVAPIWIQLVEILCTDNLTADALLLSLV
jgi:hypothetical protein